MAGESGLRMTRQRRAILKELRNSSSHPTVQEVFAAVRKELPRISLGTVYRNLDVMAERGLVRKLEVGGSQKRFDGDTSDHHHVRCVECNRVADVELAEIPELETRLRDSAGFEVRGYRVEFLGLCPRCRENRGAAGK